MKLGIIGQDCGEAEVRSLVRCGRRLGYQVTLATLDDITVQLRGSAPRVRVGQTPIEDFDGIVPRLRARPGNFLEDVEKLAALEVVSRSLLGIVSAFLAGESELLALQRLAQAGLAVLDTASCRTVAEVRELWGRTRALTVRPRSGGDGAQAEHIGENLEAALPRVARMLQAHGAVLAQEAVSLPVEEQRVIVVGEEVSCAFRRAAGDKGQLERVEPSDRTAELSRAATRALRWAVAEIGLQERDGRLFISGVSSIPRWSGLPAREEERVGQAMIEHALRRAPPPAEEPDDPSAWVSRWLEGEQELGRYSAQRGALE